MVQSPVQSSVPQRPWAPAHSTVHGPFVQSSFASSQVPSAVQWMSHPLGEHFIFTGLPTSPLHAPIPAQVTSHAYAVLQSTPAAQLLAPVH